jgi:hypothetical protein
MTIADKAFVAWAKRPGQRSLFESELILGEEMYQQMKNGVPLDVAAIEALRSRGEQGFAFDIYAWLAYRMKSLREPSRLIPWAKLQMQFGSQMKREIDYKRYFLKKLNQALEQYPAADVRVFDDGIKLWPSPLPLAEKPRKQVVAVKPKALTSAGNAGTPLRPKKSEEQRMWEVDHVLAGAHKTEPNLDCWWCHPEKSPLTVAQLSEAAQVARKRQATLF